MGTGQERWERGLRGLPEPLSPLPPLPAMDRDRSEVRRQVTMKAERPRQQGSAGPSNKAMFRPSL